MPVKLLNKGKRIIKGDDIDPVDGIAKPYAFLPGEVVEFSDETARKLRKGYPREVKSMEDVKSPFENSKSAADAAPAVAMPGGPEKVKDDLDHLSTQERELVLELRAQGTKDKALGEPKKLEQKADPSQFVNVSEEEGLAAMRAIQELRAQKEAAAKEKAGDAEKNQTPIQRVAAKLRDLAVGDNQGGAA